MPDSLIIPANARAMPKAFMRQRLELPDFTALPAETCDILYRAASVVQQLTDQCAARPSYLQAVLPRPIRPWPDIHHLLTPLFPAVNAAIPLVAARCEEHVLRVHASSIVSALAPNATEDFREVVSTIGRDLTGDKNLRTRDVCASPDRYGRYVIYPSPAGIDDQLARIAQHLASVCDRPRTFDAMVALVALTNCHPLDDGNGRLSRIVANVLLSHGRSRVAYVPWREIAIFSRGGFIVRVREAELRCNWHPLASFILASLKFWLNTVNKRAIEATF